MLRLGYCLPFLGTPPVPLFPSQCLFPAPSPSQGLFWRISPWSWFPRLLWSLLHSLHQASTAFCSWCCRPRGYGVSVITLSHLLLFVDVSHFQLGSIQSMLLSMSQGDCWPPSISGKRTFQCRFILLLVPFFASCSVTRSTSSRLCALASPRLRRSSPGSWLLFQLYSILWVSVCVVTSTPGWSSLPLRSPLLEVSSTCPSDFVQFFGIVIHPRYSNLIPSQVVQYLWVVFVSTSFRAFPSVERISRQHSTAAVFLSCA